ncbi:HNH endonuclease signature motif containing protein [Mycolicibacterium sp. OfavD-34-C]|uniref:HNH endonuclease signature motif containing protein n=1 Tax=Mycolicibacterium sp. OfavD-34-C TaxID=2917746 RepID=UPI001EF6F940|nr:HNH endonuclease signature motif containing protein [Mycolicibacterium sp. OfavD-34-C]MCG7579788.1 HNH endonuclease [Mycolicibacterium sp. OfavD-34-C]
MYVRVMSGVVLSDAVAAVRAAVDAAVGAGVNLLGRADLVDALDELETVWCQLPALRNRLLARLQVETTATQMGAKSWNQVLAVRWRISTAEAGRRLGEAAVLGPRQSITGQTLPPVLAATAAAQARGVINTEHVTVIAKAVAKLPGFVDAATREQFETDLVRLAAGASPKDVSDAAELALFLLDQDGPEPDDTERARRRGISKGRQRGDAMTPISGELTPEAWALLEAIFAKYAAPGMCNPDDPQPCTSGTPSQAQIDADHRSLAQRQHDALVAVLRIALMSGQLGQLNGLPVSVIIRTTLQDLESRAGIGVSGGGTRIPIAEVIRLAAHAHHSLAVFDKATGSALDLFRARRVASPAQRIMLIARDGGCTKPGCTVGAYGSQAHHVVADWTDGGNTNVDELGLACGPDNRAVRPDGWTTRMNERGEVEWIPPPTLDTGQTRINTYHRPERLLRPPDQQPPNPPPSSPSGNPGVGLQGAGAESNRAQNRPSDPPNDTQCGDNQSITDELIDDQPIGDALIDRELTGDELIDHELINDEPISYELIADEPSDHEPSDCQPIDHEPINDALTNGPPMDDEPIDYQLTEPSPSDNAGEPEECNGSADPGEPDNPDESSHSGEPGGPAPPDGQAA